MRSTIDQGFNSEPPNSLQPTRSTLKSTNRQSKDWGPLHLVAVDHALVTVRSLDQLFEKSDKSAYLSERSSFEGNVVRGLTAPRNASVHYEDLVEPDVPRVVGPTDGTFLVYPKWKQRTMIPNNTFDKTARSAVSAYDNCVAGRFLHDTLFDALKFFGATGPGLLHRDADGGIAGLPLPPLAIGGYYRRHPDTLTHEEAEVGIMIDARSRPPGGLRRLIEGVIVSTKQETWICGISEFANDRTTWFHEPPRQVEADIGFGYNYEIDVGGVRQPVTIIDGVLIADGTPLEDIGLESLSTDSSRVSMIEMYATYPDLYRSDRALS